MNDGAFRGYVGALEYLCKGACAYAAWEKKLRAGLRAEAAAAAAAEAQQGHGQGQGQQDSNDVVNPASEKW